MSDQNRELWQGGPWERPSPSPLPLPAVPQYGPVLRPRRRRRRRWPWFAGLLSLILVLSLSALLLREWLPLASNPPDRGDESPYPVQERSTDPPSIPRAATGTGVTLSLLPAAGEALSYGQIYEKCLPSIVSISSLSPSAYSTGTGIVLTEDGYIITNAHLVAGADLVQVTLWTNDILEASLVGFDADEDLAVLKVDAQGLTPAEFGDSASLRIGDPVAALGDPLGYRATLTDGIISSLDREVDVDGVTMVLIQTSAAINFGNSGGALISQYGQVVGVTTIKIVSDDGSAESLGFAIPSARVKYVVDALIAGEPVRPGVFGFTVNTRPLEGGGLELADVDPVSDAWAQGLRPGDVILSANGQPVTGIQDLSRIKLSLGAGDPVTLTCRRDGAEFTVQVLLIDAGLVE